MMFIRFGSLPESGRSEHQNWPEAEHVAAAQAIADEAEGDWQEAYDAALESFRWEPGVSVFSAEETDGGWSVTGSPNALAYARELADRPAYLVSGDIVGTGSDGEPCLSNVEIVREIVVVAR